MKFKTYTCPFEADRDYMLVIRDPMAVTHYVALEYRSDRTWWDTFREEEFDFNGAEIIGYTEIVGNANQLEQAS